MSKIGVNLSINVKDIDKTRLVNHTNGKTYLNMTVFIDPTNPDQYGQHGMITQDVSKEERDQKIQGPILGNVKVFWNEQSQQAHAGGMAQAQQAVAPAIPANAQDQFDDDIPF